jgi:hypothetical protein
VFFLRKKQKFFSPKKNHFLYYFFKIIKKMFYLAMRNECGGEKSNIGQVKWNGQLLCWLHNHPYRCITTTPATPVLGPNS